MGPWHGEKGTVQASFDPGDFLASGLALLVFSAYELFSHLNASKLPRMVFIWGLMVFCASILAERYVRKRKKIVLG